MIEKIKKQIEILRDDNNRPLYARANWQDERAIGYELALDDVVDQINHINNAKTKIPEDPCDTCKHYMLAGDDCPCLKWYA